MSSSRPRRAHTKSPIHGAKRVTKSRSKSDGKSSPKSTPKTGKKRSNKKDTTKDKKDKLEQVDPECGFYESSDDEGLSHRRSKRLRDVRQRKEEESSTESESDSDVDTKPKSPNKRKRARPTKGDSNAPPKKKAKKTSKKRPLDRSHAIPQFVRERNDEYLESVGIAYRKMGKSRISSPRRKKKYYYHRQSMHDDKTYKWLPSGKYELLNISRHKLVFDPLDIALDKMENEDDRMWYKSVDFNGIQRYIHGDTDNMNNNNNRQNQDDGDGEDRINGGDVNKNFNEKKNEDQDIKEKENNNNNNDDDDDALEADKNESVKQQQNGHIDDDGDDEKEVEDVVDNDDKPRITFGRLMFECTWDGWPDKTWEEWDDIEHTAQFGVYCQERGWLKVNKWYAVISEHSAQDFYDIITNIAYYGNPTTRKALKMIVNKELNVW